MITLDEAQRIISAAEHKAQQMGLPMNIAVMDAGRNLVAFHRMDGAWVASIDIAIDKAFTSAGRGLTTRRIGEMAQPGQPLFGINTTNGAIRLLIPQDSSCRITATFGFGNFNSELPIKMLTEDIHPGPVKTVNAIMGSGDATLRLTTNTGAIQIRKLKR